MVLEVSAGVVNEAEVAPETGLPVDPAVPVYHWNVGDGVPDAARVRVVVPPLLMVTEAGWVSMTGGLDAPCTTLMVKLLVEDPPEKLEFSQAFTVIGKLPV